MIRLQIWIITYIFLFSQLASAQNKSDIKNFTRADTLRGMLTPLRTCYDINYYHLDVKVDVGQKFISGSNLFRFTATRDFKKLQFDLFDNFDIEKILFEGKELSFTTEFDAVFIGFPRTIKKGTKAEFTVFYSGTPLIAQKAPWDGGFVFSEDQGGAPNVINLRVKWLFYNLLMCGIFLFFF